MFHPVALLVLLVGCPGPPGDDSVDSAGPLVEVPADLSGCFLDAACPYLLSVAHRGASRFAPENTLAAIDLALELGVHAVELDLRTSSDGVLVLMHDGDVDRTTDGTGEVDELSWAELSELSVPSEFDGVPDQVVPSFQQALEHIDGRLVVDVDVKDAEAEAMAQVIAAAGVQDQVFLLTKSVDKGEAYRAADPSIAIMPNLGGPEELEDYQHLDPELAELDFLDVDEGAGVLGEQGVRAFTHMLGVEVVAVATETVEGSWQGLVDDGAQVIQTDYPELLVPFVLAHNQAVAAQGR